MCYFREKPCYEGCKKVVALKTFLQCPIPKWRSKVSILKLLFVDKYILLISQTTTKRLKTLESFKSESVVGRGGVLYETP